MTVSDSITKDEEDNEVCSTAEELKALAIAIDALERRGTLRFEARNAILVC